MPAAATMVGKVAPAKAPPGVYRDDPDRDDAASTSSAVPLRSDFGGDDDDDDDAAAAAANGAQDVHGADDGAIPPPYVEDAASVPRTAPRPISAPPPDLDVQRIEYTHWDRATTYTLWGGTSHPRGARYTRLSPTLTRDPEALHAYLAHYWAVHPPQAYIKIYGEHTETRVEGDKRKKQTVVDFCVRFDVTDTISAPAGVGNADWAEVVLAGPEQRVRRGTRLRARHPRWKANVEEAPPTASLEEWCHVFCASDSKLKTFTLENRVTDRDEVQLERRIESIIRGTNYRGRLTVQFQLDPYRVTVATPHWLNRARHNAYVWWACVILQLWIVAWPLLFLLTRRWEVAHVTWPYRRPRGAPRQAVDERGQRVLVQDHAYGRESEAAWVARMAPTIEDAVRSGRTAGDTFMYVDGDRARQREERGAAARQARAEEPREGFAGAAMGLFRGVGNMVQEYNDSRGWGYDT